MPGSTVTRTFNDPFHKEPISLIEGSSVNTIFSGYYFTPGAKEMLDVYILGKGVSQETCFGKCWNYTSADAAKKKLLMFMAMVMKECGKSDNEHREENVISIEATALAVQMLLEVSGELLFSAEDADNTMGFLLGLKDGDSFYGQCFSMTSGGPGCFDYDDNTTMCMYNGEVGGHLVYGRDR